MNLKNKILIPFIMVLKLNAVLTFTVEEMLFARLCKHFAESVLKNKHFDRDTVTAFTGAMQTPIHPFELINNPNIEHIVQICEIIDLFCVIGAEPTLLVLGGFIYKICSMLCTQAAERYLARSFQLYELATSHGHISTLGNIDVKKLCIALKSQRELTEEEKEEYIRVMRALNGASMFQLALGPQDGGNQKAHLEILSFHASARKLLSEPLDWKLDDPRKEILILLNLCVVQMHPFAPFIAALTGSTGYIYPDLPLHGKYIALMYACRELHKRDFPGQI